MQQTDILSTHKHVHTHLFLICHLTTSRYLYYPQQVHISPQWQVWRENHKSKMHFSEAVKEDGEEAAAEGHTGTEAWRRGAAGEDRQLGYYLLTKFPQY